MNRGRNVAVLGRSSEWPRTYESIPLLRIFNNREEERRGQSGERRQWSEYGRNPPSNLSFSRAARISRVVVTGLIEIGVIQRGC